MDRTTEFPELNAFGTVLRYALALEQALVGLAQGAAEADPGRAAEYLAVAKKHEKRARQVEQWRRERLNEVVLQPLAGLNRTAYLPDLEVTPADGAARFRAGLRASEAATGRFYDDVADKAAEVLGGLGRSFRKMAGESLALSATLED